MESEKWDERFLALAEHIADWSRDPSTKVGAVVARQNNTICSTGYNGFPQGFQDLPWLYQDRDLKYERTLHAELNAILTAPEPVVGYTLYVTIPPCAECAKMVIQAGVARVVCPKPSEDLVKRWGEEFERALMFFEEVGVAYEEVGQHG